MSDRDRSRARNAILARRARFVAAALASVGVMGCASKTTAPFDGGTGGTSDASTDTRPTACLTPQPDDAAPMPCLDPAPDDTGPTPCLEPPAEDTGPTPCLEAPLDGG